MPRAGQEPLVGADPGRLKDVKTQDLLVRFAFGAAISLSAGVVSIAVNPVAGGMFLAFPAILPATITLIEKREGTAHAVADVQGAVIGAGALAPFAVVAGALLRRTGAPLALPAALVAWLLAAGAGYLAVEPARRRRATVQAGWTPDRSAGWAVQRCDPLPQDAQGGPGATGGPGGGGSPGGGAAEKAGRRR
jgi:hypothetical protein